MPPPPRASGPWKRLGQPGPRLRPAAGPALVGLGEVAYQRDDLDRALEYVTRGITLCRQFVHTPPLAAGLVTLAWIRQAAGDRRGARDAMTEAESFSAGPAGLLNPVPAQRARLLLAQDDVAGAARWAGDCGLGPGDAPDYPNEPGHLVLARLLLAQGNAVAAMRCSTAWRAPRPASSAPEASSRYAPSARWPSPLWVTSRAPSPP